MTYNFVLDDDSEAKKRQIAVVNGMASFLPKPGYSQEARRNCANGKVEVEVLIGRNGRVLTAKAISGDYMLFESSVAAARKATFRNVVDARPVRLRGILVYNFDHLSKCVNAGKVNDKALRLVKPILPGGFRIVSVIDVKVEIIIAMDGSVTRAKAVSAMHPLIKYAVESAAKQTKFSPILIWDGPVPRVKAYLLYKFKPDGIIE